MGNSSSPKATLEIETRESPSGFDGKKITVLGLSKVGKTALIAQHVQGVFVQDYYPTVEDISAYRKAIKVDGIQLLCEIYDTSGDEANFSLMTDQYIRKSEGFLIVYSVSDSKSFDKCAEIYKEIYRKLDREHIPIVLVGTKSDSAVDRVVPTAHGEELAKQLGISFFETSVKDRINVDEVFNEVVRQISRFETVSK